MKTILVVLTVAALVSTPVHGQLERVEKDLSLFLDGIARDATPHMQQMVTAGEGIGAASLEGDSFFVALSVHTVLTDGFLSFLDDDDYFELLNVAALVDAALEDLPPGVTSTLEASRSFFLYPSARLSIGFRSVWDLETIVLFSVFPQVLTDSLIGVVDESVTGLTLNNMNLGIRTRKVLVPDAHGFPAVSVGVGYSLSSFAFSYPLAVRQTIGTESLDLSGDIALTTAVHAAGVELAVSKRLAIFVPFFTASFWYQRSRLDASGSFEASLGTGDSKALAPEATRTIDDLSALIGGGLEIALSGLRLVSQATWNSTTNALGTGIAMRVQF